MKNEIMRNKINSEFYFTKEVSSSRNVGLTLYVNYQTKTYDFMQDHEEGIFPNKHNSDVETNKAFLELGLEILKFVDIELYKKENK